MRDWFDQTRRPAQPYASAGWMVGVLVCVAYESFMVARLLFAGQPTDGAVYTLIRGLGGALLVTTLAVGSAAALALCPRWPRVTAGALGALFIASAAMGMHNYLLVPFLMAIFWVTSRLGLRPTVITVTASALGMVIASRLAEPDAMWAEAFGQWSTLVAVVLVAAVSRALWGWRQAVDRASAEHEQLEVAHRERDEAQELARIAGELHDSVGHNLTAIIALSEGLTDATGDPELDDAITGINTLAREGLTETRRAVQALATSPAARGNSPTHTWDDIHALATPVRAAGVPAPTSETGTRPVNPATAELAFSIVRESVTNALRHNAQGLDQLTISINHRPDATHLAIRSTSSTPGTTPTHTDGTGLDRLRMRVTTAGGTFHAGPDIMPNTWLVRATLPTTREDT